MEQLSGQEIYNTVLFKLREQKVQSYSHCLEGYSCLYRGPNGVKCALGHLINDEEYVPEMEGKSADCLARESFMPKRLLPYLGLIAGLQTAHDDCMPRSTQGSMDLWEQGMKNIAEQFRLVYTPPQTNNKE